MSPVKFSVCGGDREGMLMQVFLEPYNKGLHSFFDCSSLGARHRPA